MKASKGNCKLGQHFHGYVYPTIIISKECMSQFKFPTGCSWKAYIPPQNYAQIYFEELT